ncbi:MAG TPA: DUF1343 domain-containing protein [Gemmatimonadales bacterium]|nr:DUF1343 domain-containing protein [Gemmatimonadales bacterium]
MALGALLAGCARPVPVTVPGPDRLAARPFVPIGLAVPVLPGIEGILTDSTHLLQGRRVGLLTNQAGIDASGVSDVDRLLRAGVRMVALFGPEHGIRGTAAPGEAVASSVDSATGLPIYSLYAVRDHPTAPTDSMLAGIDVMLIDLPDVGARYFTNLNATIAMMRVATQLHKPVVVLDRPNPIGGAVQGNVLDWAFRSPVGPLAMPMRPGLTMGELARLANLDLNLGADLRVIPVGNWRREQSLDQTGLPFVQPSPNLKDLEGLFHYPGFCLFEGTALSVGRGTELPFHQIGAPWLDVHAVLSVLPTDRLPGVEFLGVKFTPNHPGDAKFDGVPVQGIRVVLTDPRTYDPVLTALVLLTAIQRIHPDSLGFKASGFDNLAGGKSLREAVLNGQDPFAIADAWKVDLQSWTRHRESVLLYR